MAGVAKFITLEGGEGVGKSTQIRLLSDWLRGQGIAVCQTREPGGAPGAELIRNLLVTGEGDRWTPMAEALLVTAARAEHVERTVKPALARGHWVICDRFLDSTVAYQGAGRGLGMVEMADLQRLALRGFKPDLTIVLDMPVEVGLERALGREAGKASDMEDRFEKLDIGFHRALRQAFLDIAANEQDRCAVIDAAQPIEVLQQAIRTLVADRFGPGA
ncbi:MAG: dTMP kinase [Alphaproteobacteria bacterium]|nr:MAG: dTMP kinase [Alphaproteobacteria bacterium]